MRLMFFKFIHSKIIAIPYWHLQTNFFQKPHCAEDVFSSPPWDPCDIFLFLKFESPQETHFGTDINIQRAVTDQMAISVSEH